MDIVDIERLQTALGAKANVLELTLPPGPSAADVTGFLEQGLPGAELRTFLEVPHGSTWQGDVQTLCQRWGDLPGPPSPYRLGLKIRCGGAIVPTIEQVAFFIARCHENRVAWKATAGLHHPLRHRDPASQTMAHGFLNVFIAGIFTHVHSLDETQIAALLQEESVEAFRFSDEDITWRDWRCTIEQVREARAWMPSFGSCSVDEPRDDLRALRLID